MHRTLGSLLLLCLVLAILPVKATDRDRQTNLMTRMYGFQYPLDAGSNYTVGWMANFDEFEIERDFQAIRSNFSQVNLLRIPIGWDYMNSTILLTQMDTIIALGKKYGFRFMFVLMDRVSGWGTPDPRNLLPSQYTDHKNRINLVVSRFKGEGQIYAWALSNELNVFQEVVYEWFEQMIPFVKSIDFDTPVCTSFYPLGPNATSLSRAADLVKLGLDFIEFHYYPNENTTIDSDVDQLTAYVNKPIFLSEFSIQDGLNQSSTATNIRILNETVWNFTSRPNVIGLSYYRWSNDNDSYTIWNETSQAPRPEAAALTIPSSFLQSWPYSYLEGFQTNSTEKHEIFDPSFAKEIEWPDIQGWSEWHNHTAYDMKNVSSNDPGIHTMQKIELTSYDFENGLGDYYDEHTGTGGSATNGSIFYHMNNSLKMWANAGAEYQRQHTAITMNPDHAYLLEGYVNITAQTGDGAAFVQLAFKNSTGSWIAWPQSEYYRDVTNWTLIHAAGIAPSDAVSIMVNLRVNGNSGSITAYFDYLTLYEVEPGSYDGKSFMVAFGECTVPQWNAVQVSQNFTFPDPTQDIHKLWTFSASVATVVSSEYDTDWKGAFVEIAFTTSNSSEWINWYIGEYLSGNNNWTDLSVTGFPPSDALGLQMIVKVVNCHYGVMYVDNASLRSAAAVIPEEWTMPVLSKEGQSYQADLTLSTVNTTAYNGTFISPGSFAILDANNTWFKGNTFGNPINGTQDMIQLTFGPGAIEIWMPIGLILGIIGTTFIIIMPVLTIRKLKQHQYDWLLYCFVFEILGIVFVIGWLWG